MSKLCSDCALTRTLTRTRTSCGRMHLEGFFMRKPSLTSVPMSMISLYVMSLMATVSLSPGEIAMASTLRKRASHRPR